MNETGVSAALRQEYLREILAGKRKPALEIIMDAYRGGYPILGIYMDVFQEALYEIGRLWETNQITVADEHMGTAITQYVMSNLYQHLEFSDKQRGRLVMTGVQGELHQVGANMVSDVLEADGWEVMFLGTNVPEEGIIKSIIHLITERVQCQYLKVNTLKSRTKSPQFTTHQACGYGRSTMREFGR